MWLCQRGISQNYMHPNMGWVAVVVLTARSLHMIVAYFPCIYMYWASRYNRWDWPLKLRTQVLLSVFLLFGLLVGSFLAHQLWWYSGGGSNDGGIWVRVERAAVNSVRMLCVMHGKMMDATVQCIAQESVTAFEVRDSITLLRKPRSLIFTILSFISELQRGGMCRWRGECDHWWGYRGLVLHAYQAREHKLFTDPTSYSIATVYILTQNCGMQVTSISCSLWFEQLDLN